MNDVGFSLGVLGAIEQEARRGDMTFAERAGLYAGTCAMCAEFDAFTEQDVGDDSYALEKVSQYKWHIGALMGFDITNGHDNAQHLVWAQIALNSLRKQLEEG